MSTATLRMTGTIKGKRGVYEMELTDDQLATACLELCGGGYTNTQTAQAMILQRRVLDGETVRKRISRTGRTYVITPTNSY